MKKISLITIVALLTLYGAVYTPQAKAEAPALSAGIATLSVAPSIGNYLVFNGGYAKLETLNTLSLAGFSFEAWVNPVSTFGRQVILSVGEKTKDHFSYEIGINGGSFFIHYYYGEGSQRLVNAGQIQKNIWNHIAATINGSSTVLFVNGKVVYTAFGADSLKPITGNIILGNSYLENASPANIFKGLIDEVRVSRVSRNISGLWINGAYETALGSDADTLFLWHFDQIRGETSIIDASTNHLNANLIGGDSLIHFFGVLPSPTPFTFKMPVLPTLDLHRLRLTGPTITVTLTPTPPDIFPSPTNIPGIRDWRHGERNYRV